MRTRTCRADERLHPDRDDPGGGPQDVGQGMGQDDLGQEDVGRDGESAFREYVTARGAALLRIALLLTGNRADAEDLLQAALAKTYLAWDRIHDRAALDAYVKRAMVNTQISWWRRRRVEEFPTEEIPDWAVAEHLPASELEDTVRRALDRLPQRMRAAVMLRYFDDMTEPEIAAALADSRTGERLREGLVVAIAGPPNAGKSTLLNRIARREAAIVSPYAGTTRDVIEVHLDLAGWPVTLLDTAGIRETEDPVELEGVRRARERAAAADLVLWVVDAREPGLTKNAAAKGAAKSTPSAPPTWLICNKIDLVEGHKLRNESIDHSIIKSEPISNSTKPLKNIVNKELTNRSESELIKNELGFDISAVTGEGFEPLLAQLAHQAEAFLGGAEEAVVTRARHRHALEEVLAALRRTQGGEVAAREDLLAEELRIAARALGRLTGRVDVEDILDVIFRDFCIGK